MQSKFDDWHGCTALHAVRTKNATVPAGLVFRFASCKLFFFFSLVVKSNGRTQLDDVSVVHMCIRHHRYTAYFAFRKSLPTQNACWQSEQSPHAYFCRTNELKQQKSFSNFIFRYFLFFFCFNWKLCNVQWSCAMDYSVRQCENMRQTKNIKCIRHVPNNNQNYVLDGTVIVHTNNVRSPPGKKLQFRHRFFFHFGTQHTAHRAHIHISSIFYARNHPFPPFTHPFSRQHETKQKKSNIYRCFRSLSVNISFCT